MKKKIILINLIILLSFTAHSQDSIKFTISGNNITNNYNKSKQYTLPLKFIFTEDFKNKEIEIYNPNVNEAFIFKAKCGDSKSLQANTDEQYIIIIDKGKFIYTTGFMNKKKLLKSKSFYIQIGNYKSETIKVIKTESSKNDKYNPGYLLYDAITMNELYGKDDETVLLFLKNYKIEKDTNLQENKYLNDVFDSIFIDPSSTQGNKIERSAEGNLTPADILKSAGSIDVTNIADGFAKFIVKRTKQELSIAFFERFKDELDNVTDLKILFPQTLRTLKIIDNEIYMFEAYIQTLRESFEKDLSSLPSNLPEILEIKQIKDNLDDNMKSILNSGFYFAEEIQEKEHPGLIIENYPDKILAGLDTNIKASIQTLQLFSESLKSKNDSDNYWVSGTEIEQLFRDEQLLKIFLGLLAQEAKKNNIIFINNNVNDSLFNIINNSYGKQNVLKTYKSFIKNLSFKVQSLDRRIRELKHIKNDSLLFEKYYIVVSKSIDLMKYAKEVETLPEFPENIKLDKNIDALFNTLFDILQTSADIGIDINRRNYSSAIVNVAYLYSITIKDYEYKRKKKKYKLEKKEKESKDTFENYKRYYKYSEKLKEIKDSLNIKDATLLVYKTEEYIKEQKITINISTKKAFELASLLIKNTSYLSSLEKKKEEYKGIFEDNKKKSDDFKKNHKVPVSEETIQKIIKYGSFMALITQAKTSDEAAAAIEAFALPTGSARIKRESKFNVSLNAYCGLFGGYEKIEDIEDEFKFNSYGVSAPIGIAVSHGKHRVIPFSSMKKFNRHCSHSLFFSIVDIGALAAFRFANDSTESVPDIELKDIISPGIFYSFGIPKSPISVNIGWQVGPLLRAIKPEVNEYGDMYSRFSVSLTVDLPILNFYTASK